MRTTRTGRKQRFGGAGRHQSGYMLLFLMIAVAVMTIMALQVARNYRISIQREREVEMIHRGAQYARAVQLYYRKFHVFPTSIKQLENTNNIRFLRKRYKDPMTRDGQWKIAHLSDIKLNGFSANSLTSSGKNSSKSNTLTGSNLTSKNGAGTHPKTSGAGGGNTGSGDDTDNSSSVFGGEVLGPMLGVVSKSTAKGIHEFNGKSHYNQWYFIYVPAQDTGAALAEPFNPNMPSAMTTVSAGIPTKQSGSEKTPTSTETPTTANPPATGSTPGATPTPSLP